MSTTKIWTNNLFCDLAHVCFVEVDQINNEHQGHLTARILFKNGYTITLVGSKADEFLSMFNKET